MPAIRSVHNHDYFLATISLILIFYSILRRQVLSRTP